MKLTKVKYPITNPLVFAIVMKDAELCRELIERILPGRKISKIRFPEPPSSETEKTIIPGLYAKSVRLDVLFEDGESWNDIEMQVQKQSYLPLRGRYYHAAMDINQLHAGAEYTELRPSFVIFICTFDHYGMGEPVYSFEKYDVKKSLPYGDGTFTIILNTTCPKEKVPEPLREFFCYLSSQETEGDDPFIGQIHQMVEDLNGRKEIEQIMTLEEELNVRYSIGKKEGLEQGLAEGREEGLAEGKKDAAFDTARKMKADGLDDEIISKYTGLSKEAIEKL
ncbi:Rpn family recombination-promoting nuclease/putative transposase [Emergencia timonensis]|uniref:Rpn family recombination-promoting nuclease/putative transposase n=1 Tax=Emergencia timonensis TaxID=1776384 RepID=UPI00082EBEB4|nr:Rpn family recombination-promoting nuclease/putative transposase [Emergencia timonensis]WNX90244.1 Rpn family recombination-promoting nuclease/putative transposase [Emergencia timonensis]